MYVVTLKPNKENKILNGYPWIFANEVSKIEGHDVKGAVCKVISSNGKFVCIGFINHLSKILVRVLSKKEETVDREFFYNRIKNSYEKKLEYGYNNNFRVIFGESDLLPGLIVDKYSNYLSCQFLCLGMDVRKDMILDILEEIIKPKGIYERSDVAVRQKEGLEQVKGVLRGEIPKEIIIEENGLKMVVDVENGQKTGYFLDQKENRNNLKHYVKNKTVLDCFCNVGGFSLCASKYGAKSVSSVDISPLAVETVNKNAKLNGFTNITTIQADVFEFLREQRKEKNSYDVVILDPPAFTKSADTVKDAVKGYKDINICGLKIVNKGGYLITCSCSQHLTVNLFLDMVKQSVIESGVTAQLVEFRTQGKDHATLITADEGLYLKVAVLKIL